MSTELFYFGRTIPLKAMENKHISAVNVNVSACRLRKPKLILKIYLKYLYSNHKQLQKSWKLISQMLRNPESTKDRFCFIYSCKRLIYLKNEKKKKSYVFCFPGDTVKQIIGLHSYLF